jgi:hypothetical protein
VKSAAKQGNMALKGTSGRDKFTDDVSHSGITNLKAIEPLTEESYDRQTWKATWIGTHAILRKEMLGKETHGTERIKDTGKSMVSRSMVYKTGVETVFGAYSELNECPKPEV